VSDAAAPDLGLSLDRLLADERFDDAAFVGLDLAGVDLGGKEFSGCTFTRCKAQESRWRRARLDECRFEECDLTRIQVRGMIALDLRFAGCKLMGVEWAELGHLPRLAFTGCVLEFASFVGLDLRGVPFLSSQITEANFFDVDLREADFSGSELRGAVFRGCALDKADFSAATGALIDPATNDARGAVISLETAALLAMQRGLVVAGLANPAAPSTARAPRGASRSRRR
jgi:fluoroquinolone resistance protein